MPVPHALDDSIKEDVCKMQDSCTSELSVAYARAAEAYVLSGEGICLRPPCSCTDASRAFLSVCSAPVEACAVLHFNSPAVPLLAHNTMQGLLHMIVTCTCLSCCCLGRLYRVLPSHQPRSCFTIWLSEGDRRAHSAALSGAGAVAVPPPDTDSSTEAGSDAVWQFLMQPAVLQHVCKLAYAGVIRWLDKCIRV